MVRKRQGKNRRITTQVKGASGCGISGTVTIKNHTVKVKKYAQMTDGDLFNIIMDTYINPLLEQDKQTILIHPKLTDESLQKVYDKFQSNNFIDYYENTGEDIPYLSKGGGYVPKDEFRINKVDANILYPISTLEMDMINTQLNMNLSLTSFYALQDFMRDFPTSTNNKYASFKTMTPYFNNPKEFLKRELKYRTYDEILKTIQANHQLKEDLDNAILSLPGIPVSAMGYRSGSFDTSLKKGDVGSFKTSVSISLSQGVGEAFKQSADDKWKRKKRSVWDDWLYRIYMLEGTHLAYVDRTFFYLADGDSGSLGLAEVVPYSGMDFLVLDVNEDDNIVDILLLDEDAFGGLEYEYVDDYGRQYDEYGNRIEDEETELDRYLNEALGI